MKKFIRTNPIVSFVLFTFLFSWTLWLLMILSGRGLLPFNFPTNFLGSFGPFVGALIVISITQGRSGIRNILRSLIDWRANSWSYLFAIFFIIAVYVITASVIYLIDPEVLKFQKLPGAAEVIIYFFVIALAGGPLGEETGWRGFLQPALMRRFNPASTSLIIAFIWLVWHLPLFWLEGAAQKGGSIFYFALSVFAMAFLFTLLYIKAKGSLFLAILFHTMINYVSAFIIPVLLPVTESDKRFGHISTYILCAFALLYFIIYFRTFTSQQEGVNTGNLSWDSPKSLSGNDS